MCVTVCVSVGMTYGLGMLMGTAAVNMAFPSSMVLQVIVGFLCPGNAEANIVAAAVNNAISAQTLTLLNDHRTAVLLRPCGDGRCPVDRRRHPVAHKRRQRRVLERLLLTTMHAAGERRADT